MPWVARLAGAGSVHFRGSRRFPSPEGWPAECQSWPPTHLFRVIFQLNMHDTLILLFRRYFTKIKTATQKSKSWNSSILRGEGEHPFHHVGRTKNIAKGNFFKYTPQKPHIPQKPRDIVHNQGQFVFPTTDAPNIYIYIYAQ